MTEPLWPTLINWLRMRFDIKSVVECQPEDQTDEELALNALMALSGFMSKEHAEQFAKDLAEYQQKLEEEKEAA